MPPNVGNIEPKGRTPQFVGISREHHAGKKWQRSTGYGFASTSMLAPVVGVEIARAALAMPLAFFLEADRFVFAAVLSLVPGHNMMVAPDGRWLGGYIPACFRAYPFALLPQPGTDQTVLCIDAASGLLVEANSAGENFFDQDGNVTPDLKQTFDFLKGWERSRKATDVAVSALAESGVIQAWPITLKTGEADQTIAGLHRIDEAALNALSDDAHLKLRKASALPIAYAQMLSMGQLGIFEQLARLQAQLRAQQTSSLVAALPENIDSLFEMPGDDIVRFR